jgi:sterol desaturase/sphingolipid hydroxylase (fatty acid hydroxylase superfamily)
MRSAVRTIVAWIAWPGILAACILATAASFAVGQPVVGFYITYIAFAGGLLLLERWMPHEETWTTSDGQLGADLSHTLVSNGAIQGLLVFSGMIGLSAVGTALGEPSFGIWPRHWPLTLQIVLGLIVSEFAMYWAHRIAHEWTPLWHFHAVHHSVEKLWIVNSGRFHFVDAVKSVLPGIAILLMLGAPMEVLTWLSALGAFIGTLTHCNVAMRFGVLSAIFNTPELHRWHHSMDLREGNKNYGENIMLWDWLFGTWFNANRRPPATIGIPEAMPIRFRDQIVWPFRQAFRKAKTNDDTNRAPSGEPGIEVATGT